MAVKDKKQKEAQTSAKKTKETEADKINRWRAESFMGVLADHIETDEIMSDEMKEKIGELVVSNSSHHDLKRLIENGCEPRTAIEILI